jgi:SAM-dependent methyltransferase
MYIAPVYRGRMTDPIVDVRTHYDQLLARIYRWMLGPPEAALAAARRQLVELGVGAARTGARALDLGAGPGYHAIALRELGYEVWALDTSRALLAELAAQAPMVRVAQGDLVHARHHVLGTFDVILCLGDTLPHLASLGEVTEALDGAIELLAPGGRLCVSFRDQAGAAPGDAQYILVRGEADRILTCRLEHLADAVVCTDVLHERIDGAWRVRASTYRKLRLDAAAIVDRLGGRLAHVAECVGGGWITLIATAPARGARTA